MKTLSKSTAKSKAKSKAKVEPKPTSDRKRPNKTFIKRCVEFRGFMTGAEKTQLATLDVKNVMQRVNNVAMSDDVNQLFTGTENAELQALIKEFVKSVDSVLKR